MDKFRNISNVWRTRALFEDAPLGTVYNENIPIYWLNRPPNYDGLKPIMREEFIKLEDITGIKLANKFFGGYEHFKYLLDCEWFKAAFDSWLAELQLIKQAEHLSKIEEIARGDTPQAFQASKYLAGKEYEESPAKRGRPSKDEISGNLKQETRKLSEARENYKRMTGNLTLINGGKTN